MPSTVQTQLAVVDIALVEQERTEILRDCFGDGDDRGPGGDRAATIAGYLAVKRAHKALVERELAVSDIAMREIVIKRNSNGAPYLALDDNRFQISVSHTRDHAYGLVVCREDVP